MRILTDGQYDNLIETAVLEADASELGSLLSEYQPQDGTRPLSRALGYACRYGGPDKVEELLNAGAHFDYPDEPEFSSANSILAERDELTRAVEPYRYFLDTGLSILGGASLLGEMDKKYKRLGKRQQKQVIHTLQRWFLDIKYAENEYDEEYEADVIPQDSGFDTMKLYFLAALYGDESVVKMVQGMKIERVFQESAFRSVMSGISFEKPDRRDALFFIVALDAIERSDDPDALLQRVRGTLDGLHVNIRQVDVKEAIQRGYMRELRDDLMLPMLTHTGYAARMKKKELLEWAISHNRADVLQYLIDHDAGPGPWREYIEYIEFAKKSESDPAIVMLLEDTLKASGKKPPKAAKERKHGKDYDVLTEIWSSSPRQDRAEVCVESFRGGTNDEANVAVPATIAGRPVTELSPRVFDVLSKKLKDTTRKVHSAVRSVTIPGSIREIPWRMMESHPNLQSLTLKEGVESVGDYAFIGCTQLREVHLPSSLTHIGVDAFRDCPNLETVTGLGANVDIEQGAFLGNPRFTDRNGMVVIGGKLRGTDTKMLPGSLAVPEDTKEEYVPLLKHLPLMTYVEGKEPEPISEEQEAAFRAICEGDIVTLGRFPRSETLELEPIQWICVARRRRRALLIAADVIACVPDAWVLRQDPASTPLNKWLQETFEQQAFTNEERRRISPSTRKKGAEKVRTFLLSNAEADKLPVMTQYAEFTPYARTQHTEMPFESLDGLWVTSDLEFVHCCIVPLIYYNGPDLDNVKPYVDRCDKIDTVGVVDEDFMDDWDARRAGIRPAMWISV